MQAIAETAPDVIVDKVEAGSCKVVSDVEITSNPVFPQTKKYVLTAALGGIVAACGILVLDHLLHDYIGKQAFASAHHPEGYAVCLR